MNDALQKKLNEFFSHYKKLSYKKGDILIQSSTSDPAIFYLIQGTVKQYSLSTQGVEQTLSLYKPGAFFPLLTATSGVPNSYYFEAIDDVITWQAPNKKVLLFLKNEPDVIYDLIGRLYRGMHGLLTRIEYLLTGNAYQKVIFTILNASSRFGEKKSSGIVLRITHKEIASFSGLTTETISRESQKLQKKGLIENKNHSIVIKNSKLLEKELETR